MLLSIAYIFIVGMFMGWICKQFKLPSLLGMLVTGLLLGPYVLNLLDDSILQISSELRRIALLMILMRAGLSLDIKDLQKVGRPAFFMCFVPACFEILGMVLVAPKLLGISVLDAAIMGAVVGAVSPAVIVPSMLKIMEEGYGIKKSIPQLILAGASVDDVFVIVIFTAFTGLAQGSSISFFSFLSIPIAIVLGILFGNVLGFITVRFFKTYHIRDTSKVILLLSVSFILVTLEDNFTSILPFSAFIAIMTIGIFIQRKYNVLALRLSNKFQKLWVGAEILLFVLVGASVDISYATQAGFTVVVLLLFLVLCFRVLGVYLCLLRTPLTFQERIFCMIAYTPKATVQAAIGGIPLAMGLACGQIVLTVAVAAIIITATLGSFFIDTSYKKLLKKDTN